MVPPRPGVRRWAEGEQIVHQECWQNRVWAARPLTVIEDTDEQLLLWQPRGSVRKIPAIPADRPDPGNRKDRVVSLLDRGDWVHVDHVWEVDTLWILRPGRWHATWVSWLPGGEHFGWYVNLQRPYRRTGIGIEAMDLMLDITVEPDRRWHWKDSDEFDELERRHIFDQATTRRVRREAREVIEQIERGVEPFDDRWPSQRPARSGPPPHLAPGWDEPS